LFDGYRGGTVIQTYSRNVEDSARKKDTRRAEKRKKVKERKAKEKKQKEDEKKRFLKLKKQEIMEKLEKIQKTTGIEGNISKFAKQNGNMVS
jgi:protein KRI1